MCYCRDTRKGERDCLITRTQTAREPTNAVELIIPVGERELAVVFGGIRLFVTRFPLPPRLCLFIAVVYAYMLCVAYGLAGVYASGVCGYHVLIVITNVYACVCSNM